MIDIRLIRENANLVKENIKKKFQDEKLPLVDEVLKLDQEFRDKKTLADKLRGDRNRISKEIGGHMAKKEIDLAEECKKKVVEINSDLEKIEADEVDLEKKIRDIMVVIPNIIDPSVPIGKDDSENVEVKKYGEPLVPDFEIPHHIDIMESINGVDLDSSRSTSGHGFYYLQGDVARIHSALTSYARDFMIDRGYSYNIPPFMIRADVVTGVMSFNEMEDMMYKIEGEDLYLIGTSEHSMIGKFINSITDEDALPLKMTSYSPCFRKEVGAHGIEERGVYRVHQFEKQEMVIICKPEDSMAFYDELWQNSVDYFVSLEIPVRTLECCSGDLADLKVKSVDVEAWSPRQKKYFEVGSCSNLGDAQARRLGIRVRGEKGNYFAHTLNNTVVATPRALIAFLENMVQADGSIRIPKVLQPYMGGKEVLYPNK
ncbi:serine--tRNA ligase [Neofamilia massiliensis]|uniref:serine--tRNA ligase n=1 Tax=Neofamilia massiliensis TaxID=1673724 RepID=UPI0006BB86BB|nr:serine--tRNA ligase [Neofamilia massiliensis]